MDDRARAAAPGPSESAIHRVHDRYLTEVVEALGLCPFARKCRETARLARPIFHVTGGSPTAAECAQRLSEIVAEQSDVEVVLLTFVLPPGHELFEPSRFDVFHRAFREEVDRSCPVRFYMAGFHPTTQSTIAPSAMRAHNLTPFLRRTPDPVIQCVRAEVLDRVREDPDRRRRLIEREPDYEIRALLAASYIPSSQVSDDIAQQNFLRVGDGEGRRELEERLADIHEDRRRSY